MLHPSRINMFTTKGERTWTSEQLEKLARLKEQGALSEENSAAKKTPDRWRTGASAACGFAMGPCTRFQRLADQALILGGVCGGLENISTSPHWAWRILFVTVFLNGWAS